jgi:hypothetical protein
MFSSFFSSVIPWSKCRPSLLFCFTLSCSLQLSVVVVLSPPVHISSFSWFHRCYHRITLAHSSGLALSYILQTASPLSDLAVIFSCPCQHLDHHYFSIPPIISCESALLVPTRRTIPAGCCPSHLTLERQNNTFTGSILEHRCSPSSDRNPLLPSIFIMTTPSGSVPLDATAVSSVPVLGEGFQDTASPTTPRASATESTPEESDVKKRHFWQIGKKKEDKKKAAVANVARPTTTSNPVSTLRSASPVARSPSPTSPQMIPSSPSKVQGSPRVASPASSQIFERNVQEDVAASAASPAIPSHITTENHIPPVLDASSMAITDGHLNPDAVEIVTHAAHQPAAVTVATATDPSPSHFPATNLDDPSQSQSHLGTGPVPLPLQHTVVGSDVGFSDDGASNYGNLDSTDVRRLSFISFADVVHAEQAASSGDHASMRDSLLVSPGPTSVVASPTAGGARSPSPIRSPISPPLSVVSETVSPRLDAVSGSPRTETKGLGLVPGSSTSPPPNPSELNVETMTQALRRTGSGDLSGARAGTSEEGMDRLH